EGKDLAGDRGAVGQRRDPSRRLRGRRRGPEQHAPRGRRRPASSRRGLSRRRGVRLSSEPVVRGSTAGAPPRLATAFTRAGSLPPTPYLLSALPPSAPPSAPA